MRGKQAVWADNFLLIVLENFPPEIKDKLKRSIHHFLEGRSERIYLYQTWDCRLSDVARSGEGRDSPA